MKFICEKDDLLVGISTVQRALSARTTIPVLEGIVLETAENIVKMTATDLSLCIESSIQADILQPGRILLPGKLLFEIVRRLPDGQVEVSVAGNIAAFTAGSAKINLACMAVDEYPSIPAVSGVNRFTLPQNVLRSLIGYTNFSVALDESRPILTGCLFETDQESIRMVALDGCRLALRVQNMTVPFNLGIVIPGRALGEVHKLLADDETPVEVCMKDKHILFDIGHTRVIARLLEGEYIRYKSLIPAEFASEMIVSRRALEDSLERASLLARESKTNFIVLSVKETMLAVSAKSELGNVYEEIPGSLTGKEIEIGFNAKYFTDALKVIGDEFVRLCFNSPLSPCVIQPTEGQAYAYLILPIRM